MVRMIGAASLSLGAAVAGAAAGASAGTGASFLGQAAVESGERSVERDHLSFGQQRPELDVELLHDGFQVDEALLAVGGEVDAHHASIDRVASARDEAVGLDAVEV